MSKELIEKCNVLAQRVETPSSHWSADGKPDPHGKTYDCERAGLHMGNMTDDELANGAFLNYDQPLNVAGILAGTCHSPIAWMTAVKDRIRWLSRSLEKVAAERDALAAELKESREQEPVAFMHDQETRRDCVHIEVLDFLQRANSHYGCVNKIQRIPLDTTEHYTIPLYARPVPAQQLTDDEINNLGFQCGLQPEDAVNPSVEEFARASPSTFRIGDLVKKVSGSAWQGRIVGTYSTALTPEGYAVESASHPGSVQIYPAKALTLVIQEAGIQPTEAGGCNG